eukprot:2608002-Pyramimonas_sp.AAC.1
MVHCQQKVGQANDSEDRKEVLTKHLKENCYIYCPVEDKGKAKETIIGLSHISKRKQDAGLFPQLCKFKASPLLER